MMCEDITLLDELTTKNNEIVREALELKNELIEFHERIKQEVSVVIAKSPLIISKSQRLPTNIDCDDMECYKLPPPIIPQVILY